MGENHAVDSTMEISDAGASPCSSMADASSAHPVVDTAGDLDSLSDFVSAHSSPNDDLFHDTQDTVNVLEDKEPKNPMPSEQNGETVNVLEDKGRENPGNLEQNSENRSEQK